MSQPLFPFSWVQQHNVLLAPDGESVALCFHSGSSMTAILEARRHAPEASLQLLSEDVFRQKMSDAYQQNTSSTQMFETLGSEFDLDQLVDGLPEDNDLLDSDDGAPVIRLINAILSEAIKEGASDIHIEPFEKKLSVQIGRAHV